MNRVTYLATALLATTVLTGCVNQSAHFQPRAVKRTTDTAEGTAVEAGRSYFARKEYGLAIEHFRKAIREEPENPAGYNGLAASYDMLGRFDLSKRYYELALALAPEDGRIFRNMARSLDMQGESVAADALRREAASLAGTPATAVVAASDGAEEEASVAAADAAAPTSSAETVGPVEDRSAEVTLALTDASTADPAASIQSAAPVRDKEKSVASITADAINAPAEATPEATTMTLRRGHQVSVALESQTPAAATAITPFRLARSVNVERPRSVAASLQVARPKAARSVSIALDKPAVSRKSPSLLVINAGGIRGLARRTQDQLQGLGWKTAGIGDARRQFAQSWLVVPAGAKANALAIRKRLPYHTNITVDPNATKIVLLLGQNAATHEARASARQRKA